MKLKGKCENSLYEIVLEADGKIHQNFSPWFPPLCEHGRVWVGDLCFWGVFFSNDPVPNMRAISTCINNSLSNRCCLEPKLGFWGPITEGSPQCNSWILISFLHPSTNSALNLELLLFHPLGIINQNWQISGKMIGESLQKAMGRARGLQRSDTQSYTQ